MAGRKIPSRSWAEEEVKPGLSSKLRKFQPTEPPVALPRHHEPKLQFPAAMASNPAREDKFRG
jgi:hypothetical protein